MMMVVSPDQKLDMSRSGLACWMAAMWEEKSVTPSLGHRSSTGFTSGVYRLRAAMKVAQQSRP